MLTFVEVVPDWTGVVTVLSQPEFDPTVFRLEMEAKGYPYEFLPKNALKDTLCVIAQKSRSAVKWPKLHGSDPVRVHAHDVRGNRVESAPANLDKIIRNFAAMVLETQYFDKWLERWRVAGEAEFAWLVDASLRAWTKTSFFHYEAEYGLRKNPEVVEMLAPVMDGIIEKTKTLLKGERK